MLILLVGLLLFLGVHSVSMFAGGWRDRRVAASGEHAWKGIYALLSLFGLILIIWGYGTARPDAPILYDGPIWLRHLAALLMFFAMLCLAVSLLPGGKLKRMMKHPQLAAVKIWAFAHLLVNGDLASILMFGAFLAWAVSLRISLKRRGAAIAAEGPLLWDFAALALAIVLYLIFVWRLHALLFGVVPFG